MSLPLITLANVVRYFTCVAIVGSSCGGLGVLSRELWTGEPGLDRGITKGCDPDTPETRQNLILAC